MSRQKSVLVIGLDPVTFPNNLRPPPEIYDNITAAIYAIPESLACAGYNGKLHLTDQGETAAKTATEALKEKRWDFVGVGGGVRLPEYLLVFEELLNVIHEYAPGAKLCLLRTPMEVVEAVRRWDK